MNCRKCVVWTVIGIVAVAAAVAGILYRSIVSGGSVGYTVISRDGQRVVYSADQEVDIAGSERGTKRGDLGVHLGVPGAEIGVASGAK